MEGAEKDCCNDHKLDFDSAQSPTDHSESYRNAGVVNDTSQTGTDGSEKTLKRSKDVLDDMSGTSTGASDKRPAVRTVEPYVRLEKGVDISINRPETRAPTSASLDAFGKISYAGPDSGTQKSTAICNSRQGSDIAIAGSIAEANTNAVISEPETATGIISENSTSMPSWVPKENITSHLDSGLGNDSHDMFGAHSDSLKDGSKTGIESFSQGGVIALPMMPNCSTTEIIKQPYQQCDRVKQKRYSLIKKLISRSDQPCTKCRNVGKKMRKKEKCADAAESKHERIWATLLAAAQDCEYNDNSLMRVRTRRMSWHQEMTNIDKERNVEEAEAVSKRSAQSSVLKTVNRAKIPSAGRYRIPVEVEAEKGSDQHQKSGHTSTVKYDTSKTQTASYTCGCQFHVPSHITSSTQQEGSAKSLSMLNKNLPAFPQTNKNDPKDVVDVNHLNPDGQGMGQERKGQMVEASSPGIKELNTFEERGQKAKPTLDNERLPISNVESKLLLRECIRKDFVYALAQVNCRVNVPELEKGHIIVETGNADTVLGIFSSQVKTKAVHVNLNDARVKCQINNIMQEFCETLQGLIDSKKGCCSFAFTRQSESKIMEKLDALCLFKKTFSLPIDIVSYIHCHLQHFIKAIQMQMPSIKLEVETFHNPPCVVVTSDGYPKLQIVLDELFADLQYTESEIEAETAVFLQTIQGNKQMKDIERMYHCHIRVKSPCHQVVLKSVSPRNHNLLLCHGDIQFTDCQVLVLPLCDGQTEWCPQDKHILERGFLSTTVELYHAILGPPPKNTFIFPLKRTRDMRRHVMVMYVPDPSSKKKEEYISAACKEALDFVSSWKLSLALPLKLSDKLPVESCFRIMINVIREHMERGDAFGDIVLYVSDTSQIKTLIDTSSEYLLGRKGWATDIIFRDDSSSSSSHCVKIAVGELEKFETGVLVNSTDHKLEHTHATVSKLVLETAGPRLRNLCSKLYPLGIKDRLLAVTQTPWVQHWREIYHIALLGRWKDEDADKLLEELRKRVYGCLIVASANNHQSIAFPTLGTGKLFYPPQKVAQTIFKAASAFFAMMPHSSLEEINIVCFPKDEEIIKVFKAEEAVHTLKVCKSNEETRLEVGKWLVQIIVCNTEKEEIPRMCDIVYDVNHDTKNASKQQTTACKEDKMKSLQEALKREEKKEAVSLQINLRRADSDEYAEIIKAAEKVLSNCPKCIVLIMTVPDVKCLENVRETFKTLHKGHSRWFFGRSETKAAVIPSSCSNSSTRENTGVICICGKSEFIQRAKAEIMKIQVPEEYRQLVAELHTDEPLQLSHDKHHVAQKAVDQDLRRQSKENVCTLTIPTAILRGLEANAFSGVFSPVILHEEGHWEFSFPFKDLKTAVHEVVEVINSADGKSRERDRGLSRKKEQNPSQTANVLTLLKTEQNKGIERTVDALEYEALKYLLGESFTSHVIERDKKDGKVTFFVPLDKSPEDVDERIGSLRQETVSLEEGAISKIENPVDARSEGVEAFIKIIQQERKVIILCFDYNNMNKAKHLLQVKTGKLKPTSRAARKFVEQSPASSSQQPSVHSHSQPADYLELSTKSGIKVSVYKADITKLPVDAIVNAANNNLQHGGGVAAAIAKAAGLSLEEEGDNYITKHGPLKVTQVISTNPGALPCKAVLHAVGPRWDDYQDKTLCQQDLLQTVFNCLETAHNRKFGSLAVSSLSAAIFGVPKDLCAATYLQAVQRFEVQYAANSFLRQIHFVDINDEMVSKIQYVFSQKLNDKTWVDTSVNMAQQLVKEDSTRWNRTSTTQFIKPSVAGSAVIQKSYLCSDLQHLMDIGIKPTFEEVQVSGEQAKCQWQFHFPGLDLVIWAKPISNMKINTIIIWQTYGNFFFDFHNIKNLLPVKEMTELRKQKWAAGDMYTVQSNETARFVFVAVPQLKGDNLDAVSSILEKALESVDLVKAESVALTTFQRIAGNNDDSEQQASIIYSALTKFSGRAKRSVKEVHVVDLNVEFLRSVVEKIFGYTQIDYADAKGPEDPKRSLPERKVTYV